LSLTIGGVGEAMVEGGPRSREATGWHRPDALLDRRGRTAFLLQRQHHDALQAPHVEQVEAERAGTGGVLLNVN